VAPSAEYPIRSLTSARYWIRSLHLSEEGLVAREALEGLGHEFPFVEDYSGTETSKAPLDQIVAAEEEKRRRGAPGTPTVAPPRETRARAARSL
jgi:hypothetical protein